MANFHPKKASFIKLGVILFLFSGIFVASYISQQQQDLRGKAQTPEISVLSQCSPSRKVQLAISFPNSEEYAIALDVAIPLDGQTITKRYENAPSGQTVTDIVTTELDSVSGGVVNLTWSPQDPTNTAGIKTDTAFYPEIICTLPTATPIPTEEPTPTQEPTPTEEPTPTIEVVPSFVCLGGCPTPTSEPGEEVTPTPIPTQVIAAVPTPCPTGTAVLAAYSSRSGGNYGQGDRGGLINSFNGGGGRGGNDRDGRGYDRGGNRDSNRGDRWSQRRPNTQEKEDPRDGLLKQFLNLFLLLLQQLSGKAPGSGPCDPLPSALAPNPTTTALVGLLTPTATPQIESSNDFVAASTSTCGKYKLTSSMKKNYGDPTCTFTKNELYAYLKEIDPKNATVWFNMVVPCESSYNPNAFAPPVGAQAKLDAGGAWGLFQMGSSKPPGQAPPAKGKNGIYDRGDINWQLQASNAVDYNTKVIKGNWRYWACARALWK